MKPFVQANPRFNQTVLSRRVLVYGLLLVSAAAAHSQTITFTTWAGFAGQENANGSGTNALFNAPAGAAVDSAGNVYVADFNNNTIQKITSAGVVTTLAGSAGISGSTDASGTSALFNGPEGVAVDNAGNVYVADSGNSTIRKITPGGTVSTLAGLAGNIGNANGTGTNASFYQPAGVAVDSSANVYVADYGNHTIRKITPAGVVTTLAGSTNFGSVNATGTNASFYQPEGVAVDSSGNVYVADTANNMIRKISGGTVTTLAGSTNFGSANGVGTNASFYGPEALAVDNAGNVYVADTGNNMIRKISGGTVTTFAGSTNFGSADGTGINAQFWGPAAIATDSVSNIYVADYFNGTIRKITTSGVVTTMAGSASDAAGNGPDLNARFNLPESVAADSSGNVYVADTANDTIRKITPAGMVSTLAGSPGKSGSTDGTGNNALFSGPQAVAVDASGNVYVADTANNTIRKITSGTVTTLAGTPGTSGNVDGAASSALFYGPQGIAVDNSNNVYVADTLNYTIRKISGGTVSTLAGLSGTYGSADGANSIALFNSPKGLAVDGSGNVYVSDCLNHTIREITPGGVVSTLAGLAGLWGNVDGTNGNARFFEPEALTLDKAGNLYVVDSGNHTIRKLTASGTNWVVTTIAGTAGVSGSADGAGTDTLFYYPAGITINGAGNLYVADSGNNTIRFGAFPIVFGINNVVATPEFDSAFITWSTTLGASSQVQYGTTPSYGSLSSLDATSRTNHSVLLTGLVTNMSYYFEVVSASGTNLATATGTFSTAGPLIVQAPQATYTGVWTIATSSPGNDQYSSSYKYASTTTGLDSAEAFFRPTIITPGYYDVYIWYSEGANRSANVPVLTSFQGGSVSTNINQTVPGGNWQLLTADQYFPAGTNGFVRIGNGTGETGKVVIADAAQWVYSAGQDAPTNGTVPAWWANFYFATNTVNGSALGSNGYSFFANYVIGTSPVDPTSTLNFSISPLKHGIQATFSPWQGGNTYGLQSTTSLIHPAWTNVPNLTVTQDTNGDGVIVYTNTSGAQAFYRLSVQE